MPPVEPRASAIAGRGLFAVTEIDGYMLPDAVRDVDDFGMLNHSCEPNLGFASATTLLPLRPVRPGEELTVDYATAIDDPAWSMYCHCGSMRCRQLIAGDDWRIPQLQARYAGRWAPHIAALVADSEVG